jgi:hypothetical protein
MAKRKNNPVLQVDDKYFGNLWAKYEGDEDGNASDWRIQYILLDTSSSDLFDERPKDIASNIQGFIREIEKVEAKLAELTEIPVFNPGFPKRPPPEEDEEPEGVWVGSEAAYMSGAFEDEDDSERIMDAAIEHRRRWILAAIGPSNPRSPFTKLPAEILSIILEYCCDYLYNEIGDMDLKVWRLRSQDWDDWVEEEAKDLVWEGVSLAEFLFKKWKLLRKAMVKKYEATEETKKEWEQLRQEGEPPYYD